MARTGSFTALIVLTILLLAGAPVKDSMALCLMPIASSGSGELTKKHLNEGTPKDYSGNMECFEGNANKNHTYGCCYDKNKLGKRMATACRTQNDINDQYYIPAKSANNQKRPYGHVYINMRENAQQAAKKFEPGADPTGNYGARTLDIWVDKDWAIKALTSTMQDPFKSACTARMALALGAANVGAACATNPESPGQSSVPYANSVNVCWRVEDPGPTDPKQPPYTDTVGHMAANGKGLPTSNPVDGIYKMVNKETQNDIKQGVTVGRMHQLASKRTQSPDHARKYMSEMQNPDKSFNVAYADHDGGGACGPPTCKPGGKIAYTEFNLNSVAMAVPVTPAFATYDPFDYPPGEEIKLAKELSKKTVEEVKAAQAFGTGFANVAVAALPSQDAEMSYMKAYVATQPRKVVEAKGELNGNKYKVPVTAPGTLNVRKSNSENKNRLGVEWENMGGSLKDLLNKIVGQLSTAAKNALKQAMGQQKMSDQPQEVQNAMFEAIKGLKVEELSESMQNLVKSMVPADVLKVVETVSDLPENVQNVLKQQMQSERINQRSTSEQQAMSSALQGFDIKSLLPKGLGGLSNAAGAGDIASKLKEQMGPIANLIDPTKTLDDYRAHDTIQMRSAHGVVNTLLDMRMPIFDRMYSGLAGGSHKAGLTMKDHGRYFPGYHRSCGAVAGSGKGCKGIKLGSLYDTDNQFAKLEQANGTAGQPTMKTYMTTNRYALNNFTYIVRTHYNRWCYGDGNGSTGGCCIRCTCPPKPCDYAVPCFSDNCWVAPIPETWRAKFMGSDTKGMELRRKFWNKANGLTNASNGYGQPKSRPANYIRRDKRRETQHLFKQLDYKTYGLQVEGAIPISFDAPTLIPTSMSGRLQRWLSQHVYNGDVNDIPQQVPLPFLDQAGTMHLHPALEALTDVQFEAMRVIYGGVVNVTEYMPEWAQQGQRNAYNRGTGSGPIVHDTLEKATKESAALNTLFDNKATKAELAKANAEIGQLAQAKTKQDELLHQAAFNAFNSADVQKAVEVVKDGKHIKYLQEARVIKTSGGGIPGGNAADGNQWARNKQGQKFPNTPNINRDFTIPIINETIKPSSPPAATRHDSGHDLAYWWKDKDDDDDRYAWQSVIKLYFPDVTFAYHPEMLDPNAPRKPACGVQRQSDLTCNINKDYHMDIYDHSQWAARAIPTSTPCYKCDLRKMAKLGIAAPEGHVDGPHYGFPGVAKDNFGTNIVGKANKQDLNGDKHLGVAMQFTPCAPGTEITGPPKDYQTTKVGFNHKKSESLFARKELQNKLAPTQSIFDVDFGIQTPEINFVRSFLNKIAPPSRASQNGGASGGSKSGSGPCYGGQGGKEGVGCSELGSQPFADSSAEVLLQQSRMFKRFGQCCVGIYETTGMPLNEGLIANASSGTSVIFRTKDSAIIGSGAEGGEANIFKAINYPTPCVGPVSDPNQPYGSVSDYLKPYTGADKIYERGELAPGIVMHMPHCDEPNQKGLACAAVVQSVQDGVMRVAIPNRGFFPANDETTHQTKMTFVTMYKDEGDIPPEIKAGYDSAKPKIPYDNCSHPQANYCVLASWDKVKYYDFDLDHPRGDQTAQADAKGQ